MLKYLYITIINIHKIYEYSIDLFLSFFYKKSMLSCGKNVSIKPKTSIFYGLDKLSIGDDVLIPKYAHIFCTDAKLTIGNKVLFGPSPTIITGNHNIHVNGKYIYDSLEKLPENDCAVVIEDDVWVGANVTILMGVTIGRGSVIAAGSVVNKSCSPYSIIGGVPNKILKYRFTKNQIISHELALYPPEKRLLLRDLEHLNY
jgi:acetyltransferase-like isoleucine patch superfamily enzyme